MCENWGGWVEDKNISLVYHYRDVAFELHEQVIDEVTKIVIQHGFKAIPAHYALEIKTPVVWSKGLNQNS